MIQAVLPKLIIIKFSYINKIKLKKWTRAHWVPLSIINRKTPENRRTLFDRFGQFGFQKLKFEQISIKRRQHSQPTLKQNKCLVDE